MTTTATAARFYVTRSAGRYRVFEILTDGTEAEVAVVASKAKGLQKVAKLVAAADAEVEETRRQEAIAAQATEDAKVAEAIVAAVSPAAAKGVTRTEDGAVILASGLVEGSPEANAAEAAESARLDAELGITPAAKPEADTKAYRIGKVLREWILSRVTPADSALVAHITGRNVCYDGTATLRLTAEWAEELSGHATDLENAALSADESPLPTAQRAPAVMAARAARKGLAKLF